MQPRRVSNDAHAPRSFDSEDRTSMVRHLVERVPIEAARSPVGGADLAMKVLQYGTAIVAIVVATVLAIVH
jgi:hypothetical protein